MPNKLKKPKFFRGLRWKITLVFTKIAMLTWLVGSQIEGLLEFSQLKNALQPESVAAAIAPAAPEFAAHLQNDSPNISATKLQLENLAEKLKARQRSQANFFYYGMNRFDYSKRSFAVLVVTNEKATVLAQITAKIALTENEDSLARPLSAIENQLIEAALLGDATNSDKPMRLDASGNNLAAIALRDSSNNKIIGALLVSETVPFTWPEAAGKLFGDFLYDFSEMFFYIIGFGLLLGFWQAQKITERFNRLGAAANAWSSGDFSARAPDDWSDELGILAERLNQMASRLREVFALKQELAAAEERSRIARDLHDSVKQQVFAISMQLGAARALLLNNKESSCDSAAFARLTEAEKLAAEVKQELVNLIEEWRPATNNQTLDERLAKYLVDWSRQHSIAAEFQVGKMPNLPGWMENALFRIAQEALANVARHSNATSVAFRVARGDDECLELTLTDDGNGFEVQKIHSGFGLESMRERAESLPNGTLKIESAVGRGTSIIVCCDDENYRE